MSQTADIQAMLDWLASCPLATALGDDVVFSIEYLGAETTQVQFSLESTPTAAILEQFFLGSRRAKNYVLASRMEYSPEAVQQAANSAFWDEFAKWVEKQSARRNLPVLSGDKTAEKVVCLSPGYIMSQDASSCRFQIQLQLQYYQKGR
jgi:hypothetical protein|nr:MAG TPA: Minor capsid protein from bacteriophage [Caudoviricetes sp.]